MAHIDYFTFPLSPFTYLAGGDLENIAAKHNANITYNSMLQFLTFDKVAF